jgi:hypothetical protein
MRGSKLIKFATIAMVVCLGIGSIHATETVATVANKATLPVVIHTTTGPGRVLVVDTAGIEGNSNKISLSAAVTLKIHAGAEEKRIDLGHFFVFGSESTPGSYAFNLDSNPQVTGVVWQALKAGKAEAEVTITPVAPDKAKAASVRLPIHASYIELPSE